MNYKNIIYYDENKNPCSLRNLDLRNPHRLEDVFDACEDATDIDDLQIRLQAVIRSPLTKDAQRDTYVRFMHIGEDGVKYFLKVTFKESYMKALAYAKTCAHCGDTCDSFGRYMATHCHKQYGKVINNCLGECLTCEFYEKREDRK